MDINTDCIDMYVDMDILIVYKYKYRYMHCINI